MRVAGALLLLACAGCATSGAAAVKARASRDLGCIERQVVVQPAGEPDTFQAEGCGKKALYRYVSNEKGVHQAVPVGPSP